MAKRLIERPKGLLDANQISERMGISRPTLIEWRKQGLKYYTIKGHYVLYDPKDVKQWIRDHYSPSSHND